MSGSNTPLTSLSEFSKELSPAVRYTPSIVLLGMRGVGKSTLAVMASAALRYRYVDLERCVSQATGLAESAFIQKHSLSEYRAREYEIIRRALELNTHGCILVLSASCVDHRDTVLLLVEYGRAHPVIHIECEESRILNYIRYDGLFEKGCNLVQTKFQHYKQCLNFDYFNLQSMLDLDESNRSTRDTSGVNVLALKAAETDFIRFLSFIVAGTPFAHTGAHILAPELTSHSCAVQLPFPEVIEMEILVGQMTVGADAIEVVVDVVRLLEYGMPTRSVDEYVARVRRSSPVPVILTLGFELATPLSPTDIDRLKVVYFNLLNSGIRLAVDYLSVDLRLAYDSPFIRGEEGYFLLNEISSNSCNTKIIGSYAAHNASVGFWKSTVPIEVCGLAEDLGCDIVRISKEAEEFGENFAVVEFLTSATLRSSDSMLITAFNTGELGRLSKVFNPALTPVKPSIGSPHPFLAAQASAGQVLAGKKPLFCVAPSDISARDLQLALHAAFVTPKLHFYIMGLSIAGSLSPLMHNAAYAVLGLPHHHQCYQTSDVADLQMLIRSPGFGGCGISMPFKLQAIDYVDEVSEHVRRIGALNTIVAARGADVRAPARLLGENTDWLGIQKIVLENISPINAVTEAKTALVLGAGGMARASLYALISLGFRKIFLYNRTEENARDLAAHFNRQSPLRFGRAFPQLHHFEIVVLRDLALARDAPPVGFSWPTVIVHCIPGKDSDGALVNFELPEVWFDSPAGGVFMETGNDPLCSRVLIRARTFASRGWVAVNGLGFLHAQAIAQFRMQTGKLAPSLVMKELLTKHFLAGQ
ncbi:hypothetical protein BABINDRAFT_29807 [Babjeviella inositovora NRRL Y-12698]|uniref:Uncharacterized protein n=1 Tax=Babjeviella inositovora NRRL Y-12698 TaxID=984486 RepID=A0A1E3R041_9ASCO|nr:uncharacterized protein BABINDRAFT_29807 [Babjeviella inositovora NRRL Y-12698]ODQ83263.1 hypothetical protein BABINDRAFT_29807 [Babjeviella inositovora NRRL Y-12698]